MRFKCKVKDLLTALNIIKWAVNDKIPTLAYSLWEWGETSLSLYQTDFETQIKVCIPIEGDGAGRICLPTEYLFSIIKNHTDEESVECELNEVFKLKVGSSCSYTITLTDAQEYPDYSVIKRTGGVEIKSSTLRRMLRWALTGVGVSNLMGDLQKGLLFHIKPENGRLVVVGTNGVCMGAASQKVKVDDDIKDEVKLIVPVGTVRKLVNYLSDDHVLPVTLVFDTEKVLFKVGVGGEVAAQLLSFNYPDYKAILKMVKGNDKHFTIKRDHIIGVLKRASIINDTVVRFNLSSTQCVVKAELDGESVEEAVEGSSFRGEPIEIGLNPSYLLDVLRISESEEVIFKIKEVDSAVDVWVAEEWKYILAPVRLQ